MHASHQHANSTPPFQNVWLRAWTEALPMVRNQALQTVRPRVKGVGIALSQDN